MQVRILLASIFFALCAEGMRLLYAKITPSIKSAPEGSTKRTRVECIVFARNDAGRGTGVEHILDLAVAALMLVLVWPHSRRKGQLPLLWEHLQRFAWTEAEVPEVTQQRDADSGMPERMAQVRNSYNSATAIALHAESFVLGHQGVVTMPSCHSTSKRLQTKVLTCCSVRNF